MALLRGINVGGKNKVEMKRLKATFENAGMQKVRTYINSGNVIFDEETTQPAELTANLESAIKSDFGFGVQILLRDGPSIAKVIEALPPEWVNDDTMKCDVMFLWDDLDSVPDDVPMKAGIDHVVLAPGAIIWRVDREDVTRSGMTKIVGTPLYKRMTIRNCNTVRKLVELMES